MASKTSPDAESLKAADELKHQKRIKLAMYIGIFIVFQIIVMTVFGLTLMKVKTPKVRLGNNVQNLNSVPATPSFDAIFTTQIRVKNTNWGSMQALPRSCTGVTLLAKLSFRRARRECVPQKKIDVEVSLNSNALPRSSSLGSELSSGVLRLSSQAKLTGKVELMLILKKKSATMDCTLHLICQQRRSKVYNASDRTS